MAGWLIFVDTNILLDFYRLGGESAERQLSALKRHQDSLITTEQVWMEFLNNRQKVILENMGKLLKASRTAMPPILADSPIAKKMVRSEVAAEKQFSRVGEEIDRLLADPFRRDHVYVALRQIFSRGSALNLSRSSTLLPETEARARSRFPLGYPPRKKSDNSFGDALNWEWVVHSALSGGKTSNVLIVSRDGDYGITRGDRAILNDWLKHEFRERVSAKRKIELTNKLIHALKYLDERVAEEDERREQKLLEERAFLREFDEFLATHKWIDGQWVDAQNVIPLFRSRERSEQES
jgi:predicted nucleic acid-binding protein